MQNTNFQGLYNSRGASIEVILSLFEFKEDDTYIVYSPALDLAGYDTTKRNARKSFKETLKEFFRYTTNKGTFESELIKLGWQINKRKKKFVQPAIDKLLRDRDYLTEVLRDKEFSKVNSKYDFPVLA
ncbi:MAG: hypothetical protein MI921_01485 [Cytophagales bacterium]|nr:hypothetical protein [Cytophagales bacterium]